MGVRAVARAECSRIPHHKKPPRPLRPLRSSLRPPQLNLNTAAAGLDRQPAAFAGRSSPHQPWFEMAESHRNTWRVGAKRTGRLAVWPSGRRHKRESGLRGKPWAWKTFPDMPNTDKCAVRHLAPQTRDAGTFYNYGRLGARILSLSIFKGVGCLLSFCSTVFRFLLAASCFVRVTFLSLTCSAGYRPGDDSSGLSSGNISIIALNLSRLFACIFPMFIDDSMSQSVHDTAG